VVKSETKKNEKENLWELKVKIKAKKKTEEHKIR